MTTDKSKAHFSPYQEAGVDIDKANALVQHIKPLAKATAHSGVLSGVGGFGGLCGIDTQQYPKPVLVASTDGVGTKLKLAFAMDKHHTIGIDLVAMCVNDIITQGAKPLFFLDYFATGKLSPPQAVTVIQGMADGCQIAGCALLGGETAEMPGMYDPGEYDLAGFAVGIVNRDQIINGSSIGVGDVIIGLTSSGVHANGYSLIRKIMTTHNHQLSDAFGDSTLGEVLLTPTRLYVQSLLELMTHIPIKGLAHITGGGFDNLTRIMTQPMTAVIQSHSWNWPAIFNWIQAEGRISTDEMYRTFNCGIGMIIVVARQHVEQAMQLLSQQGENSLRIGEILPGQSNKPQVLIV